jgi:hypothetical protein
MYVFSSKLNGDDFVDLTPQNSSYLDISGATKNNLLFGVSLSTDKKWHGFVTPI